MSIPKLNSLLPSNFKFPKFQKLKSFPAFPAFESKPISTEVPEKIKKWREEQLLRLQDKDAAEEKAKEALRKQAEKELEDWYKRHEETIAKTKTMNR